MVLLTNLVGVAWRRVAALALLPVAFGVALSPYARASNRLEPVLNLGFGGMVNGQHIQLGHAGVFEYMGGLFAPNLSGDALAAFQRDVRLESNEALSTDGTDVVISYTVTNKSNATSYTARLLLYVDADIDQLSGPADDEFAVISGTASPRQSFEVEDLERGNVVAHLFAGALDALVEIGRTELADPVVAYSFDDMLAPGGFRRYALMISRDGKVVRSGGLSVEQTDSLLGTRITVSADRVARVALVTPDSSQGTLTLSRSAPVQGQSVTASAEAAVGFRATGFQITTDGATKLIGGDTVVFISGADVRVEALFAVREAGDVNGDGNIDVSDVMLVLRNVHERVPLRPAQSVAADVAPLVNGVSAPDGTVNLADVAVLLQRALSAP